MAIFGHTDGSDDSMEVVDHPGWSGAVHVFARGRDGQAVDVVLPRDVTELLYNALGAHLYPTGPGKSDAELTEALKVFTDTISAISGAMTSVLPLWAQNLAVADRVTKSAVAEQAEPEPKDVGHPDSLQACSAYARPGYRGLDVCPGCGFIWARHRVRPVTDVVAGPTWDDQLWAERASAPPAKTAEVPQPWTAWSRCSSCGTSHLGVRPVMCDCGHCDGVHRNGAGLCGGEGCTCGGHTVSAAPVQADAEPDPGGCSCSHSADRHDAVAGCTALTATSVTSVTGSKAYCLCHWTGYPVIR